ncbi:MAG: DUF4040 domain-containing protein [Maricaulaceae bacterium]
MIAEALGGALDAVLLINLILLTLLVIVGVSIVRLRNLFALVMLSGVYSLISALLFVSLDAVDVAFTEAAVGAGVSTVLLLAAMLLTAREAQAVSAPRRWGAFLVVGVTGAVLLYACGDLPAYGDPNSPVNAHVGRAYLERTPKEVEVPNVVTAILASYRGFDTLGETVVIFTAGLGVMLLLGLNGEAGRRTRIAPDDKGGDHERV